MRTISTSFKQSIFSQETSDVVIALLTIDNSELTSPIYISSDPTVVLPNATASNGNNGDVRGTISNGIEFIYFPFNLVLPNEDDQQAPRASLQIDNIDRTMVKTIRNISTPVTVKIQLVLHTAPDTIEIEFPKFYLKNVTWDAYAIQGELRVEQFDNEPFPAGRITPSEFPGVF